MKSNNQTKTVHCDIAIVGMSALFPGADTVKQYWQNILEKKDEIKSVPDTHWLIEDYYDEDPKAIDKTYGKRGGFIPDVNFEPMMFGMPPNALESTDSGQLLAMLLAKQVLEDAYQGQFESADKSKISVILGTTGSTELILEMAGRMERPKWVKALREEGLPENQVQKICDRIADQYVSWQESSFPGLLANVVAGRIAHRLDLGGTNFVTDAACASSLAALNISLNELYLGSSDLVITGGVDALNTISMFMCFSKTPALSMTGDCRPFSNTADGTMLGEGLGMIAIKRLIDAQRDGDQIYAVIKGLGYSSDGKGKSVYAPVAEGQATCLRRAYEKSNVAPETVGLIEAHGTATKAGDVAEFTGLTSVFPYSDESKNYCALGSVKSNIGHTKASAGIAGVIKAVLALNHKTLPATIKVNKPNTKLEIDGSALYINNQTRPWVKKSHYPRRAGVSSFGFGGTNFHVVLEEFVGQENLKAKRQRVFNNELYLFSANSINELKITSTFDETHVHKLAIIAEDNEACLTCFNEVVEKIKNEPENNMFLQNKYHYTINATPGLSALMFPGQGSQYVNMGLEIATQFEEGITLLDQFYDISEIIYPRPVFEDNQNKQLQKILTQTENAQPAIALISSMYLSLLQKIGFKADFVSGHSLGELTALMASDAINLETLIEMAAYRGSVMSDAGKGSGGMIAIFSNKNEVDRLLEMYNIAACIANHNSPNQIIVSGDMAAIEKVEEVCKKEKISTSKLPVNLAFHSEKVKAAVSPFLQYLENQQFAQPQIPVFSNYDGKAFPSDMDLLKQQLAKQIENPVNFVEQVESLYQAGVRTFIEVGPGNVLKSLIQQIIPSSDVMVLSMDQKGKEGIDGLWDTMAQLAVNGYKIDMDVLLDNHKARSQVTLDKKNQKTLRVKINGTNYGKKYPPEGGWQNLPKPNLEETQVSDSFEMLETIKESKTNQQNLELQNDICQQATEAEENVFMKQVKPSSSIKQIQESTLKAQLAFQKTLAKSHELFLKTTQQAINGINEKDDEINEEKSEPAISLEDKTIEPFKSNNSINENNQRDMNDVSQVIDLPVTVSKATDTESQTDFKKIMLEVVSDKTGYPQDMLSLKMHLENDLGIDSIKRVEILAAFMEQVGDIGEVDNNEMVKLNTLGEMVAYIESQNNTMPITNKTLQQNPVEKAGFNKSLDYQQVMLEVVSEKTGYPQDMLNLEMDLENDLGIDSIKRVEILATLMEQVGDIGEFDNNEMAKRNTLGEMVAYIESQTQTDPLLKESSLSTSSAPSSLNSNINFQNIMLEVVSEKTGYPQEMLNLDMHLENDLGIDSIKRVEILAAFIEQAGDVVEVDNNEMAKRNTLGEIVAYIESITDFALISTENKIEIKGIENDSSNISRRTVNFIERPPLTISTDILQKEDMILITDEQEGIGQSLYSYLKQAGYKVALLEDIKEISLKGDFNVLIMTYGLQTPTKFEAAKEILIRSFELLKGCADKLSQKQSNLISIQDTGGRFAPLDICQATKGGLSGLIKTAGQEWPTCQIKLIDIEANNFTKKQLSRRLCSEITNGGFEKEVGLFDVNKRGVLIEEYKQSLRKINIDIKDGDLMLVSGGAKGITAACLIELAKVKKLTIVLLGRSKLFEESDETKEIDDENKLKQYIIENYMQQNITFTPKIVDKEVIKILSNREIKNNIRLMQQSGSEVIYQQCDVTDITSVEKALSSITKNEKQVDIFIHGAGIIADKRIQDKTLDQFNRVFDTKVIGLKNILHKLQSQPLKAIALFSSVAGRYGNVGQCDYAMANEVLNKIAISEFKKRNSRNRSCLVKSINWGPWESGMVSTALKDNFKQMGISLIPLAQGVKYFVKELVDYKNNEIEVVIGSKIEDNKQLHKSKIIHFDTALLPQTYLKGHQIQGQVVIPFIQVALWMKEIYASLKTNNDAVSFSDIKCLKGIKEQDILMSEGIFKFNIDENQISLSDKSDKQYYQAQFKLHESYKTSFDELDYSALQPYLISDFYDGDVLFHQSDFKVIKSVIGSSNQGISGSLSTNVQNSLKPLMILDGGLQLAVLWVWQNCYQGSLPLHIDAMNFYQADFPGEVSVNVLVKSSNTSKTVVDIIYFNETGVCLAEIFGLQLIHHFDKAFPSASNSKLATQNTQVVK